jgi:hypothetical protein
MMQYWFTLTYNESILVVQRIQQMSWFWTNSPGKVSAGLPSKKKTSHIGYFENH